MVHSVLEEFNTLWRQSNPIEEWIEQYSEIYQRQKLIAKQTKVPTLTQYRLRPNTMQVEFVHNLRRLQSRGERKALLISATGTGKTYAAAFAVQDKKPRRMLFLVHREQILKQAMESFRNVLGDTKSLGLLSGNVKQMESNYLFATVQTMSKPEVYQKFNPSEFDFIVIDETHRSGAESYQNLKIKLGHIPKISEFDEFGSIHIVRIFDNNSLGSYYKFLVKYEKRVYDSFK